VKLLFIGNVGYRFNSFVLSSALAAQQLGIEFHVAGSWTGYENTQDKMADEEKYGVTIHQIDFIRAPYDPRNLKAYRQVVDLINKEQFDVIHCNTPIGGVVGRLAGKKCKVKKIIYEAHGFHFYTGAPKQNWLIYYPIEKWLAHKTDALITINKEDYERAQKKFHLRNNGKVYYVPGVGIDLASYASSFSKLRKQLRAELGLAEDDVICISAGDLNTNKNNGIIIEALKQLRDSKIHYIVCGEGPLKAKLESEAQNLPVHFLGYRQDIKELLIASDVFVMPSYREGLSRSIMEAMASGLPCLVSKIRGNTDLIVDDKGGYVIAPEDIDGWTNALKKISSDVLLRNQFGQYNKERISRFDLTHVVSELKEIYRKEIG